MKLDENTVVLITGAASGIGESMAAAFAERGCVVVLGDVDESAARVAAEKICAAGGRAVAEIVDVSDQLSVNGLAQRVFDRFGHIDVLCCNAGVSMRPFRTTWQASLQDYEWLTSVNYFGFVHSVLSFVPRMREQTGRRQLVLTASVTALDVSPGHGPYAATKAAVTALADALRVELAETGTDFGVTVVYPGYVPTKIATSERLRPVDERSGARDIQPFEWKHPPREYDVPVDVGVVAERIVGAVVKDANTCLTHPYPEAAIEARLAKLRVGAPLLDS
ncbi:SDR family NAD(P)-dependent oxidoreductase [Nocardia sp. CA2R105]|uniref:SDR family NAD(P)-dependent oxidoreductase n=1 Tax=Nocardia coffeae TaxID=2873381 RepID=UPI001CA748A5|nr:SDR family NAD(P)-dependent oxidoreductase [Nocardia coffeae]MBY8862974.1 SDR family NAD(P)-dependent oxidoreductase [Nocardia coffeae]